MNYYQINLHISPKQPWTEILTQDLADIDFESFSEEEGILQAYINEENFNEDKLKQLIASYSEQEVKIEYSSVFIPYQNWNATWEADYQPVKIDKDLLIRAPFHDQDDSFQLSIEIQPQMSFGTGHHQTTYLLSKTLLNLDFSAKKVLDVGTGTGVLGILASLRGATSVFGTDIEDEVINNAIENCQRNGVMNFEVVKGDIDVVPKTEYDVIIANININVLLRHLEHYAQLLKKSGALYLSGFFITDVETLVEAGKKYGLLYENTYSLDDWAVLHLKKQ